MNVCFKAASGVCFMCSMTKCQRGDSRQKEKVFFPNIQRKCRHRLLTGTSVFNGNIWYYEFVLSPRLRVHY